MTAGIQVDQRWVPALATLGLSVPLILLVLRGTKQNTKIILLFCLLISAAVSWFSVVSNVVQEPYLVSQPQFIEMLCTDHHSG